MCIRDRSGIECFLVDAHNRIRLLNRGIRLRREELFGDYVSFFAPVSYTHLLFEKLSATGANLLLETLEGLEKETIVPQKQGESPTAYARMLKKEMGCIDWEKPAVQIERLIRGLNPWPSAYTHLNGKTMKIWEAKVHQGESNREPGAVTETTKEGILVQTGEGLLEIRKLQLEGKKRMDAGAFLRGCEVKEGTKLC